MRLIDADELLDDFDKRATLCKHFAGTQIFFLEAKKVVNSAPTIEAEPVRHGRWVYGIKCNCCGQVDTTKPNYCPNCGAKMDGGAEK